MSTTLKTLPKRKYCDFTFALSDLNQCNDVIQCLPDFDTYAYIKHFPDIENGSEHYHFYIHLKQPISINNLSEKLDIPVHMIEWVRVKTKIIQYLIHKNNPEKIQYSPNEIETNNREYINKFLFPSDNKVNIFAEYSDLSQLSNNLISPFEYLEKHSDSISNLPFYSRSIYLMRLIQLQEDSKILRK